MDVFEAVRNGDLKFVKRYVEQGGDVNKRDKKGSTPLMIASFFGRLEIVKFLVENFRGINENKKNN